MEAHLREMVRDGPDPEYRKHARKAVERFAARFGDRLVNTITGEDVSDFLHDLPFEPLTKRHYRTHLVTAYKWFIRQRWATDNSASAVPAPKVTLPEPGILTVEESERLFRANEKSPLPFRQCVLSPPCVGIHREVQCSDGFPNMGEYGGELFQLYYGCVEIRLNCCSIGFYDSHISVLCNGL